ncbi:hypothetical protein QFC22_002512 [Naganishia vaughanmartiniae]|uniref:Uncharacterized protein n=1 Tax=Naganishia vaughanmartiniae TaxID=1424756 RepID=A0ACC2X9V1_9TREE|nr:hypothetical protein QFC22_002512 [Naganishia vaughanmartiniae]
MIPLKKFLAIDNRRSEEQKVMVPSSRKRHRSDKGSSNEERPATSRSGSKQKAPVASGGAPLTFEAAPLSDESDFDQDDTPPEEDGKRTGKRTGKKKKKEAKVTESGESKSSVKRSGKASHEPSSADEVEVENEDSQTFAVFKMRTAHQEQARKEAERQSRRISQQRDTDSAAISGQKHLANHINQSSGSSAGSSREEHQMSTLTISGMSQSVKLSKRTPLRFPVSGQEESVPYHVMQRKAIMADGEDEEYSQDEEEELRAALVQKRAKDNEGNVMIPSYPPLPASRKTLLDLLIRKSQPRNTSHKQRQRNRGSDRSNNQSGSGSSADEGVDPSPKINDVKKLDEKVLSEDISSNDDDDDEILRFDTTTGRLIRPLRRKKTLGTRDALEPGQSEEEPDFVPTLVDMPRPSKQQFNKYQADASKRVEILKRLNAEAERVGVQFFYDRFLGIQVDDIGLVKGGVLGDDMGLGKTIQVLAFLSAVMRKKGNNDDMKPGLSRKDRARASEGHPFKFGKTCLITCPKTLVNNWKREIDTWTNLEFGVIESKADRESVIRKYQNGFLDLVLVPFDRLVGDIDVLKTLKFSIKNATAARTIAMKSISAECRFAMTEQIRGNVVCTRFCELKSA